MSRVITGPDFYRKYPKHVVVDRSGMVYTSPVESCPPPLALDDLNEDPDFLFSFQPFQFRWDLKRYPQFAFIPKSISFVGPLLGRLAHFKIDRTSAGRYALAPDTLQSWLWLEDTLSFAINRLGAGLLLPMEVTPYSFPYELGYKRSWKSKRRAVKVAMTARETFVVMIGHFSMLFSYRAERYFCSTVIPGSDRQPTVSTLLKADAGLSDSVIQDLIDMHSLLGLRVGVLFSAGICPWFKIFHHALAWAGVSYWVCWGKASPSLVSRNGDLISQWRAYLPEYDVLRRCALFLGENDWPSISSRQLLALDEQKTRNNAFHDLPHDGVSPSEPIPNGQVLAETPHQFIQRRTEEEKVKREKASPDELLRWTHRQRHADRHTWTSKSKVYYWPQVAGVRKRTLVEKSQVVHCWENTEDMSDRTNNQRIYSAVFDEWDICTEFDPSDETPLDDDHAAATPADMGDVDPPVPLDPQTTAPLSSSSPTPPQSSPSSTDVGDGHPTVPPPNVHPSTPQPLPNQRPPPLLPANHNQQGLLFAHASGIDDEEVVIPELDVLMYDRHGFDVDSMALDIKQGIVALPSDAFSLSKVAEILMEKDAVASSRSEPAVRLIATLIDRGLPIPDRHWDLRNGRLRDANQNYFNFLPLKLTSLHSDDVLSGYTVNPTSSRYLRPWVLFFESAIGVAQCIREAWGPSLEDVVCKACRHGYRIHMFVLKNNNTLPRRMTPTPLFPRREREEGFIPSHFDFHAYQHVVDVLIMQPRLRAAVLRGGILGRICSPYISLDEVADGPSPDALRYGLRWQSSGLDSVYVEDFISEEEIHLLCGYFYVDTCKCMQISSMLLR